MRKIEGKRRRGLQEKSRSAKNSLNHLIRRAKAKSWNKFIAQSSTKNPFGFYYKIITKKVCGGSVLYSHDQNLASAFDFKGANDALLDTLVSSKPPRESSGKSVNDRALSSPARQIAIGLGARVAEPPVQELITLSLSDGRGPDLFTVAEVGRSLLHMRTGRAQGPDLVMVEMLCSAWVAIPAIQRMPL